jgi:RND superfamily putative drug exporter
LTAALLVLVFGGLITACIPVLAALASSGTAVLGLYGFSFFVDLDQNTFTLVTLLCLGLSIDYGLLLVGRFREETRQNFPVEEAVRRAWQTAGRTVAFGAFIVIASLGGLLTFSIDSLAQVGVAGVSSTLVAMLAALTLTPALLGVTRRRHHAGSHVRAGRGRGVRAKADRTSRRAWAQAGFFAWLATLVQRRPVAVAATTTALLLVSAAPLAGAVVKIPHLEINPPNLESVATARDLTARFGQNLRVPITYATCWYSWRMPPAWSRLRMRKVSRSMAFSGRGCSGAAWPSARCGRCWL